MDPHGKIKGLLEHGASPFITNRAVRQVGVSGLGVLWGRGKHEEAELSVTTDSDLRQLMTLGTSLNHSDLEK